MATPTADTDRRPGAPLVPVRHDPDAGDGPIRRPGDDDGPIRRPGDDDDPIRRPGDDDDPIRRPPEREPGPEPEREPDPEHPAPEPKKEELDEDSSADDDDDGSGGEDEGSGAGNDGTDDQDGAVSETISTTDQNDDGFGDKGSEGKYWEVDLVRPPGGSEGLISYIAMAEAAIQTAVDLLGRGMPTPPPEVGDLLTKVTRETLGKGKAEEAYQDTLTKVEAKQTSLLVMDNQVIDTSIVMAGEQDRTLNTIIDIIERLNGVLTKVGSAKLKPAMEIKVLEVIAQAITLVYEKVTAVSDLSSEMAGGGGEEGSGGGGTSGGGGGGAGAANAMGGLGSMLPMLAMLPMSLMPLATQMLPELLNPDKDKDEDEEGEESGTDEESTEPIDPTAPPSEATAPNGQPAPNTPDGEGQTPQDTASQAQA
ncbi:hypothetical protein [Nocardia sp. NPDC051750]|uniref:hypothetical protein n=1 Tax=Nocardia sp. NPDC051750 TaxID=3364325 RepID=UPI0037903DED